MGRKQGYDMQGSVTGCMYIRNVIGISQYKKTQ